MKAIVVWALLLCLWPSATLAAYVTPTSRSTGFVVTAARWNQDVVDNMIAVRTALLDSVVNETAATDMTISPTGDELVLAASKSLRITGSSGAAPPNAGGIGFDSGSNAFVVNGVTNNVTLTGTAKVITLASTQSGQTSFADLGPTMTTAANSLKSGSTFKFVGKGSYGTNSTDTVQIQFLYGATVIAQTPAFNPASGASSRSFTVDADFTLQTLNGASSSLNGAMAVQFVNQADSTTFTVRNTGVAIPVNIDATASSTWKMQVKHGSSNASNTETLNVAYWMRVN